MESIYGLPDHFLGGGDPVLLAGDAPSRSFWSPDGALIFYTYAVPEMYDDYEVYAVTADGTPDILPLTHNACYDALFYD